MMTPPLEKRPAQARAQDGVLLRFLYHTPAGRLVLKALTGRGLSRLAGKWLDSPLSKPLIKPFLGKNGIDPGDYLPEDYRCFNDCFCRRIRPELRPINKNANTLIAPCDGLLSVYPIRDGALIPAKHSRYTLDELLGGDPAADAFDGGTCLVFRLCVHHYHRYCFPDDGQALRSAFIPGKLHTVRPIALETTPVFVQNCREYTLMTTKNLGLVAQIEVGALLVGKISNHPLAAPFVRGQEKGCFLYGGSTIILLLPPGKVRFSPEVFSLADQEMEIPVKMGEPLAYTVSSI